MSIISTSRRQFLGGAGALAAASALPCPVFAQGKPKVVVIGGGPGGATAAKYIAKDSAGAIEVTLVEPTKQFVTCFHSNLYLGGFRNFQSITHNYGALGKYGVKLAHTTAAAIDKDKKTVRLANGTTLPYDRLVIAPGIDIKFDFRARLFRGCGRKHAACLETRAADAAPEEATRSAQGWRPDRHGRAA